VRGKVVVVTGATSGIGEAAAIELARRGATVVPVGRDGRRLERTSGRLQKAGGDTAEPLRADFASLAEVRQLASDLLERHERIDVLVNNAGIVAGERRLTQDGYESTFAVNHLAPFLLTNLLLGRLRESAPARVVTTASIAHASGRIDFDDLHGERDWSMMSAYSNSKLANVLFTRELARRVPREEVAANCLHPGAVGTRLGGGAGRLRALAWTVARPFLRSPAKGAGTIVYLAVESEGGGVTGGYFADERLARSASRAQDDETARRLWEVSEQLTGLSDRS
jgi:NAD(P)-dependent dehydrogenase (short-subunit alcohol dehydrogenase family)